MKARTQLILVALTFWGLAATWSTPGRAQQDHSPQADEQQLPRAMHSAMEQVPSITVGQRDAQLVGSDHRALQAAVDYIAGLGGGIVEIAPGDYMMHDSLHLRSNVTVRGAGEQTRLCKAASAVSPLALDGDFGQEQVTVEQPEGFQVGFGVAVWDDSAGGFHTTVARITGKRGNTFSLDQPLMADCMCHRNAKAATVFPVISGCDTVGATVENLAVIGNKKQNARLNGCRGAGIYLFRGHGTTIRDCTVQGYNGDGISFQQSNDVRVIQCTSENNAQLGLHPGSGSQRPVVRQCVARNNGTDGLFLCWRVRHGRFEGNVLENNGRYGISIGHKDTDNLLQHNRVYKNAQEGIYFRKESLGMAAHRNRLLNNIIENNGTRSPTAGIRIRGFTNDLLLEKNLIRDTRPAGQKTQTIGIAIEPNVGPLTLRNNGIEAETEVDDQR